jgi:hypothetical protein
MSPSTSLNLLLLLLGLPLPASAAVAWHCWYNFDQNVACTVRQPESARPWAAPELRAGSPIAAATPPARLGANALPPSVRLLRDRPYAFRGRTILIPIYTEPFDRALAAELVESVMCGREPDCTAHYGERPAMTLGEAADFADANDPLLASGE